MTDPTLIVHIRTNAPHQMQWFRSIAALPRPLNAGQVSSINSLLAAQRTSLVSKESMLRAHPPDPTQRATLIPIINELIHYLNAMQIAQPQVASNAALVMAVLRQIEAIVAGGPASPAVQQVAQNLDRLSRIAIQEAIAVEAELKIMLSEEAQKIRIENAIMLEMQAIVGQLTNALDALKAAMRNPSLGKSEFNRAIDLLTNATTGAGRLINDINIKTDSALKTDAIEQQTASKIAKQLKTAFAELTYAAAEIKRNNSW